MIYNLQSLRGLLAVAVLAAHFGFNSDILTDSGDIRIAGFMMLSAFVFTLSSLRRAESNALPTPVAFMKKRIAQLYPLYLVGLIISLILTGFHQRFGPTLADFLMLQSWVPNPDYYFSGNPPTWFISSIMFCYLAFLPTFRLAYRKPKCFAVFMASYLTAYFIVALNISEPLAKGIIYVFPPMQFATYLFGIVLAFLYHFRNIKIKSPLMADLAVVGILALKAALLIGGQYVSTRFTLSSYWWPSTFVLLIILSATDKTNCLTTRILHSKPLLALGNVSFSFYILHYPWIIASRLAMDHLGISLTIGLEFCLSVPLLAIIAHFSKKYFETPVANMLK